MTQRKQWTAQEKLAIVLQGMSGNVSGKNFTTMAFIAFMTIVRMMFLIP